MRLGGGSCLMHCEGQRRRPCRLVASAMWQADGCSNQVVVAHDVQAFAVYRAMCVHQQSGTRM